MGYFHIPHLQPALVEAPGTADGLDLLAHEAAEPTATHGLAHHQIGKNGDLRGCVFTGFGTTRDWPRDGLSYQKTQIEKSCKSD